MIYQDWQPQPPSTPKCISKLGILLVTIFSLLKIKSNSSSYYIENQIVSSQENNLIVLSEYSF